MKKWAKSSFFWVFLGVKSFFFLIFEPKNISIAKERDYLRV